MVSCSEGIKQKTSSVKHIQLEFQKQRYFSMPFIPSTSVQLCHIKTYRLIQSCSYSTGQRHASAWKNHSVSTYNCYPGYQRFCSRAAAGIFVVGQADKFNVTIFIQFRTFFVGLGSCNRLARDMFAAYLNDLLELSQLFILLPHFGLHLHLFVFNPFGLCNKTFQSVSKGC